MFSYMLKRNDVRGNHALVNRSKILAGRLLWNVIVPTSLSSPNGESSTRPAEVKSKVVAMRAFGIRLNFSGSIHELMRSLAANDVKTFDCACTRSGLQLSCRATLQQNLNRIKNVRQTIQPSPSTPARCSSRGHDTRYPLPALRATIRYAVRGSSKRPKRSTLRRTTYFDFGVSFDFAFKDAFNLSSEYLLATAKNSRIFFDCSFSVYPNPTIVIFVRVSESFEK